MQQKLHELIIGKTENGRIRLFSCHSHTACSFSYSQSFHLQKAFLEKLRIQAVPTFLQSLSCKLKTKMSVKKTDVSIPY